MAQALDEVERSTETLTKTIICKLETSNRKNERVRAVIDEWQTMAGWLAARMRSVDADHWRTKDSTIRHMVDNAFPKQTLLAHVRDQAAYKVGEAFGSWDSNGRAGESPRGRFGDGDYARFSHDAIRVVGNDRGFGLTVGLHPRDYEWFHIDAGEFQRPYLESAVEDDTGSCELHLHDDGGLSAHLSVKRDVEVIVDEAVERWIGVCLGESKLYAAVLLDADGEVEAVQMNQTNDPAITPRAFRHHRERFRQKRADIMQAGDLRRITDHPIGARLHGEHRRHTDWVTHNVSAAIVEFATDHYPCGIRMEDMTHARETAADWIHDFPFHEIQTKVAYKAEEAGLPVAADVSPAYTKQACRKCGYTDEGNRDGAEFVCGECGYHVDAFVNGAANVARGGVGD